jgi:hypothetical protein
VIETVPAVGVMVIPFLAGLIETVTLAAPSAFSIRSLRSPMVLACDRSIVVVVAGLVNVTEI